METLVVLECGCERELINGKWVWVYCEEHEEGHNFEYTNPITKFRKGEQYD